MRRVFRRISSILTALFLLAVSVSCFAVPMETAAVQDSGNISMMLEPAFEGVGMSLVDIGIIDNGSFVVNETFEKSGISFDGVETSKQLSAIADKAVSYAKENQITGFSARVDFDGELNYYDVDADKLYLMYQTDGFETVTIQPVIVSVPQLTADNTLNYDISVQPKFATPDKDYYSAALILTKLNDNKKRLPGAEFSLWRKIYYTDITKEHKAEYEYGEDAGGLFYWKKSFNRTTDENGQIAVSGMAYGEYRFIEEKAPKGYVLDPDPIEFNLDTHGEIKIENDIFVPSSGKTMELTAINKPSSDISSKPEDVSIADEDYNEDDNPNGASGAAGGSEDSIGDGSGGKAQLTGDELSKYIIIGAIVGVSFVVIILLVIFSGRKKKNK